MTSLTPSQQAVADSLIAKLGSHSITLLSGAAGTGKTYTLSATFDTEKVLFLCPTHASKSVLEAEASGANMEFSTLHSKLGWTPVGFRRVSSDLLEEYDMVVVDEASMLDQRMAQRVIDLCESGGTPLVFTGDAYQLSNIEEGYNVFNENYPTLHLTVPMRYKDATGGISTIARTMRHKVETGDTKSFKVPDMWDDVKFATTTEWLEGINTSLASNDDFVVVASTHQALREVRAAVTGDGFLFKEGDTVRSLETGKGFTNGVITTVRKVSAVYNVVEQIDIQKVYSARPAWLPLDEWKSGKITFNYQDVLLDGLRKPMKMPADGETEKKIKLLQRKLGLKSQKIKTFDLQWLSTVHAAQGETWSKVYVHTPSVLRRTGVFKMRDKATEHNRLVYVALSRAKDELHLLKY